MPRFFGRPRSSEAEISRQKIVPEKQFHPKTLVPEKIDVCFDRNILILSQIKTKEGASWKKRRH